MSSGGQRNSSDHRSPGGGLTPSGHRERSNSHRGPGQPAGVDKRRHEPQPQQPSRARRNAIASLLSPPQPHHHHRHHDGEGARRSPPREDVPMSDVDAEAGQPRRRSKDDDEDMSDAPRGEDHLSPLRLPRRAGTFRMAGLEDALPNGEGDDALPPAHLAHLARRRARAPTVTVEPPPLDGTRRSPAPHDDGSRLRPYDADRREGPLEQPVFFRTPDYERRREEEGRGRGAG